jgi:hypothetical protein
MKTVRWVTFVLVFVIVFSAWAPAPALAGPETSEAGGARPSLVSLTVINKTLGALQVTLESSGISYSFYVGQGKTTYQIVPGKYTYTVRFAPNNPCKGGWPTRGYKPYLVKTRRFNSLKNTLGPYRVCTLG